MNTTTPPDFRVLVVQKGKRVWAYGETAFLSAQRELRRLARPQSDDNPAKQQERDQSAQELSEQLALLETYGVWKGVWVKPPIAAHEAEIYQRCLTPKEEKTPRKLLVTAAVKRETPDIPLIYDGTREAAARAEVLITDWEFAQPVSMEGFRSLPLAISRAIDEELLSLINPSTADSFLYFANAFDPLPTPEPTPIQEIAVSEPPTAPPVTSEAEPDGITETAEESTPALIAGAW